MAIRITPAIIVEIANPSTPISGFERYENRMTAAAAQSRNEKACYDCGYNSKLYAARDGFRNGLYSQCNGEGKGNYCHHKPCKQILWQVLNLVAF